MKHYYRQRTNEKIRRFLVVLARRINSPILTIAGRVSEIEAVTRLMDVFFFFATFKFLNLHISSLVLLSLFVIIFVFVNTLYHSFYYKDDVSIGDALIELADEEDVNADGFIIDEPDVERITTAYNGIVMILKLMAISLTVVLLQSGET